ncbi:MAG: DUF805 domain-containing protein [Rhodobacteraceae bacterium]|nr:DUF805 domain-containing protein [Paracoccaceae bacterium]
MGFVTATKACYSKYFTFSGRARHPEFWWFFLFFFVVNLITSVIEAILRDFLVPGSGPDGSESVALALSSLSLEIVSTVFFFATIVPFFAACVRRLHDSNLSGWWALLNLLPVVGTISTLVLCTVPSTNGANRFGPDPHEGSLLV